MRRRFFRWIKMLLLGFFAFALVLLVVNLLPWGGVVQECAEETVNCYVVTNGYHIGIAVPVKNQWHDWKPRVGNFEDTLLLEFGWGARHYYMAGEPGVRDAAQAVLWLNESVLHVARYTPSKLSRHYRKHHIHRISLCPENYRALCEYIDATFDADSLEAPAILGKGMYGDWSAFYAAHGWYNGLYNCNNWAAGALRTAGINTPVWGSTSVSIWRQLPEEERLLEAQ